MTVELNATHVLAGVGALVVLVIVWRGGSRRAKATRDAARSGAGLLLTGRVLAMAAGIVGAQWIVIIYGQESTWLWVALGLPALFAAYALARALTVTAVSNTGRRGGRR